MEFLDCVLEWFCVALSIKTEEADRLARQLAGLTGESMTQAVTGALQERLQRLEAERRTRKGALAANLLAAADDLRTRYDIQPVTKSQWDAPWSEE